MPQILVTEILAQAIQGRRRVAIWYDPGVRVIEPHALGVGSDGQLLLRAFQVSGVSVSRQPVHWKLFRLDRIRDAKLSGGSFRRPRPEYKRDDPAMTGGIIAQI
jgi:predicted DNA-binding transcriptional regulator YafY